MMAFGPWLPDLYAQGSDSAGEALNVLPRGNSYGPFPQLAATSLAVGVSTITVTIASPAVVSWTAHGLIADDLVTFTTTGALPTGMTAGTTYFVLAAGLAANTFRFSLTSGGAAINTSGSQSGVHTATYSDGVVRGAFAARSSTNTILIYAGTASKLYQFAGVTTVWTNETRTSGGNYALATDEYWASRQFGTAVVFANGSDVVQSITTGGANFAALAGSPPNSRFLAVVSDFLMLGAPSTNRLSTKWSGRNNAIFWTAGQQDSDGQVFPDGGDVQGITGLEQGGLVFQSEAVRRMGARTDSAIFEFHKIDPARGTSAPYSIVLDGGDAYYYSTNGFTHIGAGVPPYGGQIENIGVDAVNEWFKSDCNNARFKAIIGALDPILRRIFWLYPSTSNASSTTLDRMICFDIERKKWTHANVAATYIFTAASPGWTLSALAAVYTTLTAVPYPFGSDVWRGGAPGLAAFGADNKLAFFSGVPMAGTLQTSPFEPVPDSRAFIRGFRIIGDSASATGTVGVAERPENDIAWAAPAAMNAQGHVPTRSSGRIAQIQVDVPAGATWRDLQGVDFEDTDVMPDGKR